MERKRFSARRAFMAAGSVVVAAAIVAGAFIMLIRDPFSIIIGGTDSAANGTSFTVSGTTTVGGNVVLNTATSAAPLDVAAYEAKLLQIANLPTKTIMVTVTSTIPGTTTVRVYKEARTITVHNGWPASTTLPEGGALLPFNRIVAYYGNFYSTQMGVLGEYPPDVMLAMLASTTAQWAAADPSTPVIPALDYIAVTAQGSPGPDGKYRLRMPASQIQKALDLADQIHGLLFLDVQVAQSNVETEVPLLAPFLKLPNVELCLDPEFDMPPGARPDTVIGTMDASDINFAAHFLANLVDEYHLPPKILVVHRFTQHMVTNYRNITPLPQVEIVMDMDGWGPPAKKISTYNDFIAGEPVQFTGFKLFYKNDLLPPSTGMLTPQQILKLSPQPSFIQYQ